MEWQLHGGATPVDSSTKSDNAPDGEDEISVGEERNHEVEEEVDHEEMEAPSRQAINPDLGLSESERGRP